MIHRKVRYYCTESSEHNAEYNPFYIKKAYPELVEKFNIPLDEYPRRCVSQIEGWEKERDDILADGKVTHTRSEEYASYIMESIVTGAPYKIGGNVLNEHLIDNLPLDACVEVPCLVDRSGITPCHVGPLPTQLGRLKQLKHIPSAFDCRGCCNTEKRAHISGGNGRSPHRRRAVGR